MEPNEEQTLYTDFDAYLYRRKEGANADKKEGEGSENALENAFIGSASGATANPSFTGAVSMDRLTCADINARNKDMQFKNPTTTGLGYADIGQYRFFAGDVETFTIIPFSQQRFGMRTTGFSSGTAKTIATITMSNNASWGFYIEWVAWAQGSTYTQSRTGVTVIAIARDSGGSDTSDVVDHTQAVAVSAGTLTCVFTYASGTIKANLTTSESSPTLYLMYNISALNDRQFFVSSS